MAEQQPSFPVLQVDLSEWKGVGGSVTDDGDYEIKCGPNPKWVKANEGSNMLLDLDSPVILDPDFVGVPLGVVTVTYGRSKNNKLLSFVPQALASLFSYTQQTLDVSQIVAGVTRVKEIPAMWFANQKLAVRLTLERNDKYGDRMSISQYLLRTQWESGAKVTDKGKCGARRARAAEVPAGVPQGFVPNALIPAAMAAALPPDLNAFLGGTAAVVSTPAAFVPSAAVQQPVMQQPQFAQQPVMQPQFAQQPMAQQQPQFVIPQQTVQQPVMQQHVAQQPPPVPVPANGQQDPVAALMASLGLSAPQNG